MTKQASRTKLGWVTSSVALVLGSIAFTGLAVAQSPEISAPSAAYTQALSDYEAAWSSNGLAFSTVAFSDGPSSGYGQYTTKTGNSFTDGEPIALYAEPVGYAFAQSDAGYSYNLSASYRLLNKSGQVLTEQAEFAEFNGTGRSKQRELSAGLSFQFTGLPAGDYQLQTTFTDTIGNQSASFSLPFTVTGAN